MSKKDRIIIYSSITLMFLIFILEACLIVFECNRQKKIIEEQNTTISELTNENYRLQMIGDEYKELFIDCVSDDNE